MRLPRSPPPKKAVANAIRENQRENETELSLTNANNRERRPSSTEVPGTQHTPQTVSYAPEYLENSTALNHTADLRDGGASELENSVTKQETRGKTARNDRKPSRVETAEGGLVQVEVNGEPRASESSPSRETNDNQTPEIRRLDSNAYRPWGTRSNNTSPEPGSGTGFTATGADSKEPTVCRGGPGKTACDKEVKDGEGGVECEKCCRWYHSKCQGLSKGAMSALNKWHGTLVWLCNNCSKWLQHKLQPTASNTAKEDLARIDQRIEKLENIMRHNSASLSESVRNQEKLFTVQCKVLDRMEAVASEDKEKKQTYAEALKGISTEVVKEVTEKISKLPQVTVPVQRNREEIAGVLDELQDKERRKFNVIVHNLPEASNTDQPDKKGDQERFTDMIKNGLKLVVKCTNSFRIRKKIENKPRLLLVTLATMEDRTNILRSAATLRSTPEWGNVYITPDLTWQEREKARTLRQELARRKALGEEHIHIRQGRIVPVPVERRRTPLTSTCTSATGPGTRVTRVETGLPANTTQPETSQTGREPSTLHGTGTSSQY